MRPSWDDYFISIVDATALRASCNRGKSAAVIVKDKRILATGYVGSPSGLATCDEEGHDIVKRCEIPVHRAYMNYVYDEPWQAGEYIPIEKFSVHCIRTIHAETNAVVNCARNGVSTLGATLYCTMTPCVTCAMMIIQAGIVKVIAKNAYQKDKQTREMFKQVNIELIILNEKLLY